MPKERGGLVREVSPDSLGEDIGVVPGDRVLSVNGHELRDEIDFRFYGSEEKIRLKLLKRDGSCEEFELEKDPDDLLGISFADPLFDGTRVCQNTCCFCFIRQLPKGLRPELYVRDDDYRLSFLYGNFITLTNLSEADYLRIAEQRLSPLRVSVHATRGDVRASLMGNPRAASIVEDLARLCGAGIDLHIQIVLLRGINDGPILEETLRDLWNLGEKIVSVGVVPAIYTRYRRAPSSEPPDYPWASKVLDTIDRHAQKALETCGKRWVYAADEFYITAKRDFPGAPEYDGFPQYENGIGIVADFRAELDSLRKNPALTRFQFRRDQTGEAGRFLAVTGEMASAEISRALNELGLSQMVELCVVPNAFFGEGVTCAGLLTGQDILIQVSRALRERKRLGAKVKEKAVLVPKVSAPAGRFLDGFTLKSLSGALGLPVVLVEPSPRELLKAVMATYGEATRSSVGREPSSNVSK